MPRQPLLWSVAPADLPFPATADHWLTETLRRADGSYLVLAADPLSTTTNRLTLRTAAADGTPGATLLTLDLALADNPFAAGTGIFGADVLDANPVLIHPATGGGWLLVWRETLTASGYDDGYGGTAPIYNYTRSIQRFAADGTPGGRLVESDSGPPPFAVETRADGTSSVFSQTGTFGSTTSVLRTDLTAAGTRSGPDTVLASIANNVTVGDVNTTNRLLAVERLADGGIVLVLRQIEWNQRTNAVERDIVTRVLNADGTLRHADIVTATQDSNSIANLFLLKDGGFLVAHDIAYGQQQMQRFDASGTAIGPAMVLDGAFYDPTTVLIETIEGHFLRFFFNRGYWNDPASLMVQEYSSDLIKVGGPHLLQNYDSLYDLGDSIYDGLITDWPGAGLRINAPDPLTYIHANYVTLGDGANTLTLASAQRVMSRGGNDTLTGSAQDDTLFGGAGNDSLSGGNGDDFLSGDAGNDQLFGGGGQDSLYGMEGADTLDGGAGDDFLFGGQSDADARDVIYGGDGHDSIDGAGGNDELHGGLGNDTVQGGSGADTVVGNAGDDLLAGMAGADAMFGGPGNDTLNGGFGYDRLNGGAGADLFLHAGVAGHGTDWIQDFSAADGDALGLLRSGVLRSNLQVNFANTPGAGDAAVAEAFVIWRPTGQILWALVDGAGLTGLTLRAGDQSFDLLA